MPASITSAVPTKPTLTDASRSDLAVGNVVTLTSTTVATTYLWQMVYRPPGSAATFSGSATAQNPGTFTVDVVGSYLVMLTTDGTSTIYVRLAAKTVGAELLLNAATEQYNPSGTNIPVDIGSTGWTNNLNANLQALENYSRSLWLWQDSAPVGGGLEQYQYSAFFPTIPINSSVGGVPAGVPCFFPLDGYVYFASELQTGQWSPDPATGISGNSKPSQWTVSNNDLTITSSGYTGASPVTQIGSARWGRGSYYTEIEGQTVAGADICVGLISTDSFSDTGFSYNTDSSVRTGGPLAYNTGTGIVYVNGSADPGTYAALSNGDVLGLLIKFMNPDAPTAFGSNGWEAQAYFRVNGGAWLNGANPVTDTGGVPFSANFTVGYVFGVSLDTSTLASATWEVDDYSAIVSGDWISIGSDFLSATVSWRGAIYSATTGAQTLDLEYNGVPVVPTLTGVMGLPNRALGQFDASLGSAALRAADIALTINTGPAAYSTTFSASVTLDGYVILNPIGPGPWGPTDGISFGASTGSISGVRTRYFNAGGSNNNTANNIASALGQAINRFGVTAYENGSLVFVRAEPPGPGNAVVATSNGTAFTVPSLTGGLALPVLNLLPTPGSWSAPAPGGTDPWYTTGEFMPNSNYSILASFTGSGPAINISTTNRIYFDYNGIGRSLLVVTSAAYNGGNVRVTFIRFDTGATVVRTVTPVVGGGTVHIQVPVLRVVQIETLGATFAAGTLSLQVGPYWTPVLAPASNVNGVSVPSPIATVPAPAFSVQDINQGIYQVILAPGAVVGEDGNMLDLYHASNPYPPSPSGDRRYFSTRVYFVVTNNP